MKNEVTNETTNLHHSTFSSFNTPGLRAAIGSSTAHRGFDVHVSGQAAWTSAVADGWQRLSRTRAILDEEKLPRHHPLRREHRRAHRESLRRETHAGWRR